MREESAVLEAARRRAAALAECDAAGLEELLHHGFRWTSFKGEVFDRARYIAANTGASELWWIGQKLEEADVVVAGDAALLIGIVVDEVERAGISETVPASGHAVVGPIS